MKRVIYALIIFYLTLNAYAWNAAGHKVVAQIAYDNLSPNAKIMCHKYLSSSITKSNRSFITAATWMDDLRAKEIYWYDEMHYIDIPFSDDKRKLPPIGKINAIWAIKQANKVLLSKKTNLSDKRLALYMLIHITGDIHQPLHTVTKISNQFPKGDLGGNLFPLGKNPIGNDLHHYWDRGAGFFIGQFNAKKIKLTAHQLEKKWPCASINNEVNPAKWAKYSHKLAIQHVYKLSPNRIPSIKYQKKAQNLVQKQVAFAGCRLAALLNHTADKAT